jgi:hypothetical protein
VTQAQFELVFADEAQRFSVDHYPFLFSLIKHYELAYETDEPCFGLIIPILLSKDKPAQLPIFELGEGLMLKYTAESPVPAHTISRFIVRHNQQIKKQRNQPVVWRFGVVLEDEQGTVALVREIDRSITIAVKGVNQSEFISQLRATMDDIFASYKSKKPQLLYRVESHGLIDDGLGQKEPLWLTDDKIINHVQAKRPYFEDRSGQDIDLNRTLNQYNISINAPHSNFGGHNNQISHDHSTHFNFKDCNMTLQGDLNDLAQYLAENDNQADALELQNAAKALEQVDQCETPQQLKTTGVIKRLGRLVEGFGDKNSTLYKSVAGIKHGASIVQDIGKGYNKVAQWSGLPQVPKVFLGKEKSK